MSIYLIIPFPVVYKGDAYKGYKGDATLCSLVRRPIWEKYELMN